MGLGLDLLLCGFGIHFDCWSVPGNRERRLAEGLTSWLINSSLRFESARLSLYPAAQRICRHEAVLSTLRSVRNRFPLFIGVNPFIPSINQQHHSWQDGSKYIYILVWFQHVTNLAPLLLNLHHISVIALPRSLQALVRPSHCSGGKKASVYHLHSPLNYFPPPPPPPEATERLGDDSADEYVLALIYLPLKWRCARQTAYVEQMRSDVVANVLWCWFVDWREKLTLLLMADAGVMKKPSAAVRGKVKTVVIDLTA